MQEAVADAGPHGLACVACATSALHAVPNPQMPHYSFCHHVRLFGRLSNRLQLPSRLLQPAASLEQRRMQLKEKLPWPEPSTINCACSDADHPRRGPTAASFFPVKQYGTGFEYRVL